MKKEKINILKFNDVYSDTSITIGVPRKMNRVYTLKYEDYIIDKIYFKDPDIFDKDRRSGSLIISLKGKMKREIEILNNIILFFEEYEKPIIITKIDNTIETITKNYRSL